MEGWKQLKEMAKEMGAKKGRKYMYLPTRTHNQRRQLLNT
jgi:hypothetical protein